jgi:hypothetical protein
MDDYRRRLQLAELEHVVHSPAAATSLAENYVGSPLPEAAQNAILGPPAGLGLCRN